MRVGNLARVFGTSSVGLALLPSLRPPAWPPYPCPLHAQGGRGGLGGSLALAAPSP